MDRNMWVRLDNASNIFLAAMTDRDTKVFRLTAEMSEKVDPLLLQKALDHVYKKYSLYHSVLRRGFFWYYLEMSELQPQVMADILPPCAQLYHFDRKELLFRVIYHDKRIHLEVFHVLSDGTGALWFFKDLLKEYVALLHPEQLTDETANETDQEEEHLQDSFRYYFRKEHQNFSESARSAFSSIVKTSKRAGKVAVRLGKAAANDPLLNTQRTFGRKQVYRVKGRKTPDNRPRVIELSMPLKKVLTLAREQKVSLTIYMTALFFEAVRKASSDFQEKNTIAVSVPVNLRQFYPSQSARNFFSTTRLAYTYGSNADSVSRICSTLNEQFLAQLDPEKLAVRLNRLIAFEYNPFGRLVPRPLKDLILKLVNWKANQHLTIAISNMGKVVFPAGVEGDIEQFSFHTSAVRPQFCMASCGERLTVSFTSPFIGMAIHKEFVRLLTGSDVSVTVSVNQVTSEELGGNQHVDMSEM